MDGCMDGWIIFSVVRLQVLSFLLWFNASFNSVNT